MTITSSTVNANFTTAFSCGGICNQLNSAAFISGTEVGYNAVPLNDGRRDRPRQRDDDDRSQPYP